MDNSVSSKIRNMSIVCAFFVVVIHCRPAFELGSIGWWVRQLFENGITAAAVPFFFIVSGFFISRHIGNGEYRSEVWKRVRTLLVPYFLWIGLFWVYSLGIVNLLRVIGHRDLYLYFPNLEQWGIWLTGNPLLSQLWYVKALFLIVLASPLLYRFIAAYKKFGLLILFALYVLVCPWTDVIWNGWVLDLARCGAFPVLGIFYFSVGLAIGMGILGKRDLKMGPWSSLSVGLVLIFLCAWFHCRDLFGGGYFGCLSIPFVLSAMWQLIPNAQWPDWLVRYSFAVYVLHVFFIVVVRDLVNFGLSPFVYLGGAVVVFVIALLTANVLYRILPRFSSLAFGGR